MKTVRNCTALVTGAASGIGLAISRELAAQGCHVCLTDVNEPGLIKAVDSLKQFDIDATYYVADLANPQECLNLANRTAYRLPQLNILVNNAGIANYSPTGGVDPATVATMIQVNLTSAITLTVKLIDVLQKHPEAHIVNLSSMFGRVGSRKAAVYAATKFGLAGFSDSLRFEYGRRGLGVSTICPGFVKTPMIENEQRQRSIHSAPPLPDWVQTTPEHVARKSVQAILRNRREVVITPLARSLVLCQRFCPSVLDWLSLHGRRKRIRRKQNRLNQRLKLNATDQHARSASEYPSSLPGTIASSGPMANE